MKQILHALLFAASAIWAADSSVYIRNVCDSLKWSEDPVMHMVFESAEVTDWTGKFDSPSAGETSRSTYGEDFFSTVLDSYWKSPYAVPYALDAPCSDPAKNVYKYQTFSVNRGTWTLNSKEVYSRLVDMSVDTLKGFEDAYNWVAFPEDFWNSTTRSFDAGDLLLSRTLELHASTFHVYAVYFDTSLAVSGKDSTWTIQYYSAQALDLDSSSAFETALSTLKNSLPQSTSASGNVRARVFKFTLRNQKDAVLAEGGSSSESAVSSASAKSSSSQGASAGVVASSSSAKFSSSSLAGSSSAGKSSGAAARSSSSDAGTPSSSGMSSATSPESASSGTSSESPGSSDSGIPEGSSNGSSGTEGIVVKRPVEGTFSLDGRDLRISALGNSPLKVEIYDVMGNRVRKYTIESHGEAVLPLGDLPTGTYLTVVSGAKPFARPIRLR